MSKQRYYAHAFGSEGDGSLRHVVTDRNTGTRMTTTSSARLARDMADRMNRYEELSALDDVYLLGDDVLQAELRELEAQL